MITKIKNKKIICLWGGPGTGKSTTAAEIFALLKKQGFNAEMSREYIKDWVWEGRKVNAGDQVYFSAKTARKEATYIRSGIDFIVTDSPLALTTFYGDKYDKYESQYGACRLILQQHYELCKDHGYKIDHYFLVRTKEYNPKGRYHTEDEAVQCDVEIKNFLDLYPINYKVVTCDDTAASTIVSLSVEE